MQRDNANRSATTNMTCRNTLKVINNLNEELKGQSASGQNGTLALYRAQGYSLFM